MCLAMTNKYFLRAAHGSGQPLRVPSGSKHGDLYKGAGCRFLEMLLHLMWPTVKRYGKVSHKWTVMLCFTCWRYLPLESDKYWLEKRRELLEVEGRVDRHVEVIVDRWRGGGHRECPMCYHGNRRN